MYSVLPSFTPLNWWVTFFFFHSQFEGRKKCAKNFCGDWRRIWCSLEWRSLSKRKFYSSQIVECQWGGKKEKYLKESGSRFAFKNICGCELIFIICFIANFFYTNQKAVMNNFKEYDYTVTSSHVLMLLVNATLHLKKMNKTSACAETLI